MAITFHVRGDDITPRRVAVPTQVLPLVYDNVGTVPSSIADSSTGTIGGAVLSVDETSDTQRMIKYVGLGNFDPSGDHSILVRGVPRWTGFPLATTSIWSGAEGIYNAHFYDIYLNTSGQFIVFIRTRTNTNAAVWTTTATWSATADTCYDIGFSWDGTTTADALKLYIDGSSFETATAAANGGYSAPFHASIYLGGSANASYRGDMDVNECVVWNEIIDFTSSSIALDGGTTGSLNGASRTAFVASTASDGIGATGGANNFRIGI